MVGSQEAEERSGQGGMDAMASVGAYSGLAPTSERTLLSRSGYLHDLLGTEKLATWRDCAVVRKTQSSPAADFNPNPEGDPTLRFMMLMIPKGYETAAPGTVPDAKTVEAMMKYNESLPDSLGVGGSNPVARSHFRADCPNHALWGKAGGKRKRLGSRLNSGLAQSTSRSYPDNDLADFSISGGSTRRVALTERTRSASTFLGLPLTRNSGKSSQRT